MSYFIGKTGRMILLHKRMYAMLLVEAAVGMFLFSFCLNITMSCNDTVRKIDKGIGTDAIQLTCQLTGTNYQPDGFPVEPDRIERLRAQKSAEGLGIQYLSYVQGTIFFSETGENAMVWLIFADEESCGFLGFRDMPEEGYVGSRAAEILRRWKDAGQKDGTDFGFSSLTLYEDRIAWGEEWECRLDRLRLMEAGKEERVISAPYDSVTADEQILLTDCIVLPIDRMEMLVHAEGLNGKVSIQFFLGDWSGDFKVLVDFVKELNTAGGDYHFSLTQQSVALHNGAEDLMIPYRTSLWVGISVLAITASGMIGAFILILHRREKTNAVAVACGATYIRLFGELLAEVGGVILTGTIIGMVCSVPSVLKVHIRALSMRGTMHVEVVFGCIGIAVLSALIICGGATLLVRGRQLAGVLKES